MENIIKLCLGVCVLKGHLTIFFANQFIRQFTPCFNVQLHFFVLSIFQILENKNQIQAQNL